MNVGARLALARSEPNAAAVQMTTKSASDSPLTTTRRYGESRKRWRPSGSGRPVPGSSFGFVQSAPSATNETTSTVAPPTRNSHPGTGRSRMPPMPWAAAARREGERDE